MLIRQGRTFFRRNQDETSLCGRILRTPLSQFSVASSDGSKPVFLSGYYPMNQLLWLPCKSDFLVDFVKRHFLDACIRSRLTLRLAVNAVLLWGNCILAMKNRQKIRPKRPETDIKLNFWWVGRRNWRDCLLLRSEWEHLTTIPIVSIKWQIF